MRRNVIFLSVVLPPSRAMSTAAQASKVSAKKSTRPHLSGQPACCALSSSYFLVMYRLDRGHPCSYNTHRIHSSQHSVHSGAVLFGLQMDGTHVHARKQTTTLPTDHNTGIPSAPHTR
jgi:hypothetical protein